MRQSAQASTDSHRYSKRPYILFAIFLSLLAGTCYLLPKDPIIAQRIANILHPANIIVHTPINPESEEKNDPPMGIDLPSTGAGKTIYANSSKPMKGYLLVGLGNCTSCISFNFRQWENIAAQHKLQLIGFSGGAEKDIDIFRKTSKLQSLIAADEDSKLTTSLNSYWAGRLYYFDANWRLRWVMRGMGNTKTLDDLSDLKKLLEEKS